MDTLNHFAYCLPNLNIWFAYLKWLPIAWDIKYALFKLSKIWLLPTFSDFTNFHTLKLPSSLSPLRTCFSPWLLTSHMPCTHAPLSYHHNPPPWIILNKRTFWTLRWEVLVICCTTICIFFSITLMQLYSKWLVNCLFPSLDCRFPQTREQVYFIHGHNHKTLTHGRHKAGFQRYFWLTKQQMPNKTTGICFWMGRPFK